MGRGRVEEMGQMEVDRVEESVERRVGEEREPSENSLEREEWYEQCKVYVKLMTCKSVYI